MLTPSTAAPMQPANRVGCDALVQFRQAPAPGNPMRTEWISTLIGRCLLQLLLMGCWCERRGVASPHMAAEGDRSRPALSNQAKHLSSRSLCTDCKPLIAPLCNPDNGWAPVPKEWGGQLHVTLPGCVYQRTQHRGKGERDAAATCRAVLCKVSSSSSSSSNTHNHHLAMLSKHWIWSQVAPERIDLAAILSSNEHSTFGRPACTCNHSMDSCGTHPDIRPVVLCIRSN